MRAGVWCDKRTRGKKVWKLILTGLDGKEHWEPTHATSEREAKELLRARLSELAQAKAAGISPEMLVPKRFKEFVEDEYLPHTKAVNSSGSHVTDSSRAKNLYAAFGDKFLRSITPGDVQRYVDKRAKTVKMYEKTADGKVDRSKPIYLRPATVNRELMTLSGIFREAKKRGYVDRNPCEDLKQLPPKNERIRWLTDAEEETLLKCLAEHLRPIVVTALHTGMRKGELFKLRWADVDLEQRLIRVDYSKTHKRRFIPINDTLLSLLDEMKPADPSWGASHPVFVSPVAAREAAEGEKKGEAPAQLVDLKHGFTGACRRAGLEDFHFHDLRHSFASRLAQAGRPLLEIAELLGHGSLKMTMRYAHLAPGNLRAAVEVLSKSSESVAMALQSTSLRKATK